LTFAAVLWFAAQMGAAGTDDRVILLVRHAERADAALPGAAKPPAMTAPKMAADPELSEAGRERAKRLAEMLQQAGVTSIYSTEYRRTRQTAEPLASALGIQITAVPASDVGGLVERLKHSTGVSLVVGHSNTIPDIVKALGATGPVRIADDEYDGLYVLIPRDGAAQLLQLKY
jgi:phosphohistidine phosphatase SixA